MPADGLAVLLNYNDLDQNFHSSNHLKMHFMNAEVIFFSCLLKLTKMKKNQSSALLAIKGKRNGMELDLFDYDTCPSWQINFVYKEEASEEFPWWWLTFKQLGGFFLQNTTLFSNNVPYNWTIFVWDWSNAMNI